MQLKEKYSFLEKSKVFKEWHSKNKASYLAHVFRMYDDANKNIWQFGFYNNDDTITTFIIDNEKINEVPEEKIFKKDKHKLKKLSLENVKVSFEDAMKEAEKLREKKYSQHPVLKKFAILQVLEKQVYNITFVTQTFHTLNIHIDSDTRKIVDEKLTSLMDIAKIEKGNADKPNYIG